MWTRAKALAMALRRLEGRQEGCEQTQKRQERAEMEHVSDARVVRQLTENGGSETPHAKGKTEEKPGDKTDLSRDQFLCVDEDRGKSRRENDADTKREDAGPEKIGIRQQEGERRHAQNREPDDILAAEAVSCVAADQRACRYGKKKKEEEQLRSADGYMKFINQKEGIIAAHAGQVKIF